MRFEMACQLCKNDASGHERFRAKQSSPIPAFGRLMQVSVEQPSKRVASTLKHMNTCPKLEVYAEVFVAVFEHVEARHSEFDKQKTGI